MIVSGRVERWYPMVGAFVVTAAAWRIHGSFALDLELKDLFGSVINVSSILVGFFAATKGILFAAPHARRVKQLKELKLFPTLISYLLHAITACLVSACFSGLLLVLSKHTEKPWYFWLLLPWVFVASFAVLSSYRAIRCLSEVLSED